MRTTARVILENEKREILLIQRQPGEAEAGKWCIPGGKLDPEETLPQTAARELAEETGYVLTLEQLLPWRGDIFHQWQTFYFLAQVSSALFPTAERENDTPMRWVSEDEARRMAFGLNHQEIVMNYFQMR